MTKEKDVVDAEELSGDEDDRICLTFTINFLAGQ